MNKNDERRGLAIIAEEMIVLANGLNGNLKTSDDDLDGEKLRRDPSFLPPRTDLRKRYRVEDLPMEERADYEDVVEDEDLKSE